MSRGILYFTVPDLKLFWIIENISSFTHCTVGFERVMLCFRFVLYIASMSRNDAHASELPNSLKYCRSNITVVIVASA